MALGVMKDFSVNCNKLIFHTNCCPKNGMMDEVIYEGNEKIMSEFKPQQISLLQDAATLGKLFSMNEDKNRFDKLKLFGEKLMDEEYMIGFAGHFSVE